MGRLKVSAIARADVVRFHQSMKAKPGAASRCLALLSKMFNLAEKWGIRPDGSNPCRHVEKYPERSLGRFLSLAELARLGAALREAEGKGEHPSVIGALRLLTFTGCRRNEILTLRWEHVDLAGGCLRLPSSKTGRRVVPLGAPALAVLAALPRREGNPFVLPGNSPGGHCVAVEKAWRRLRERAELGDVRLHDLRHSFAPAAAAMGEGLPVIGALLGHADQSRTKRYTHFSNDPLRAAADRISRTIAAALASSSRSTGARPRRRHPRRALPPSRRVPRVFPPGSFGQSGEGLPTPLEISRSGPLPPTAAASPCVEGVCLRHLQLAENQSPSAAAG
jgi:integrase